MEVIYGRFGQINGQQTVSWVGFCAFNCCVFGALLWKMNEKLTFLFVFCVFQAKALR
jgi:hypothetical protein